MKLRYRMASAASIICFASAMGSAPVSAQSTSGDPATNSSAARGDDHRDHDYGWLGLLGLAGLAGLFRRHRNDTEVTGRQVTR